MQKSLNQYQCRSEYPIAASHSWPAVYSYFLLFHKTVLSTSVNLSPILTKNRRSVKHIFSIQADIFVRFINETSATLIFLKLLINSTKDKRVSSIIISGFMFLGNFKSDLTSIELVSFISTPFPNRRVHKFLVF